MGQLVREVEAACKLEWGNAAYATMTFIVKFNTEQMLEQVAIRARIKGRTEPCCRDYRGTRQAILIRIGPVKIVLDDNSGRYALGNRSRRGETSVLATEVVVILSKGNRIFRPGEGLPKE